MKKYALLKRLKIIESLKGLYSIIPFNYYDTCFLLGVWLKLSLVNINSYS